MPILVLSCPKCGAPLPRQARWRMVPCPHCGSMVTRSEDVVPVDPFKEAWARAQSAPSGEEVRIQEQRYRIQTRLGRGPSSEVLLADRVGVLPERVVLKVAEEDCSTFDHELDALRKLGEADPIQCLPQPIRAGISSGPRAAGRKVLVMRHLPGHWGTLADYLARHPEGVDPRHGVWMWRRVMGTLGLIHGQGWAHGQLSPEHLLLHPRDHGVMVLGWSQANPNTSSQARAHDLLQVAWSIRVALCGSGDPEELPSSLPTPLAELLERSCDQRWVEGQDPSRIDLALQEASKQAFGPPQFIPFVP